MIHGKIYPKDSSEYRIHQVLAPLVKEMNERFYTPEFKRTPEFNTEEQELETLGIILSKYCEWEGGRIQTVGMAAFEDANFNEATIELK